jgi:hypothetical protein
VLSTFYRQQRGQDLSHCGVEAVFRLAAQSRGRRRQSPRQMLPEEFEPLPEPVRSRLAEPLAQVLAESIICAGGRWRLGGQHRLKLGEHNSTTRVYAARATSESEPIRQRLIVFVPHRLLLLPLHKRDLG